MKNTFSFVKKLFLFSAILVICLHFNSRVLHADSYPLSCGLFEVSYINNDGSLSKVECYNDISSARNKMRENEDYVVRSQKSLSPTKIVDMNSGLVYTYPYRANTLTQKVYSNLNSQLVGSGAYTYLTIHYPMLYLGNKYYDEKKDYSRGWVHVNCHGFDGYTDLEYVDFVPYKYLINGIPITLGGNDKTSRNEQPFKVVCKPNTYEAQRNGNYTDLLFTFYRGWSENTNGGEGLRASSTIGVAPSFMTIGTKYYSNDGVNFYSDIKLTNLVGTYYNYYQFLPFRTKSNISGSTLDAYLYNKTDTSNSELKDKGNDFKNNESLYGCNAVLTYAMAIHESGWGKSSLSHYPYYNLFGYGAYDSNVSLAHQYPSISDCVASQMADNLANYLDVMCGSYFTMSLGTKGGGFMTKYASDPYWAEKISHYYYDIDKFNNGYNGNLSDYNFYNLALINSYNVAIKRDANPNSATLYQTANKNGYQCNLITVTLGEANGFTKVQLSNPIDGAGNVVYPIQLAKGTLCSYDFNRSVGYIPTSALVSLNYGTSNNVPQGPVIKDPQPDKMEPIVAVDEFNITGNTITLKGVGAISYSNFTDLSKIKHEFVLTNLETGNEATFNLTTEEYGALGLNDGYDYKYCGFNGSVDLTPVIEGSFKMSIRITNGEYVKEKVIINNGFEFYCIVTHAGEFTNRISSNARYAYRLELEISKTPLDYSLVNIAKNRASLFSFDNLTIDENLNMHIDGQAFIYYTNYDNPDNVSYKIHLIKDNVDYKTIDANKISCSLNYTSLLNSSYDLSNICFEANADLSDLSSKPGKYKMILEINKVDGQKTYIDYIEMTNLGDYILPENTKDNILFKFIESTIRERIMLEVSENEN